MLVTTPVGMLIGISTDMLFYSLVLISVILWVDVRMIFGKIREEAEEKEEGRELSEVLVK